ncbi:MAG: prolipoprotein diacylglyceryl transferase [Acidobacteriota bacterium]|nr:prolipoprotein diacylglyceryl transferase [Acidobacteriota bacterium]
MYPTLIRIGGFEISSFGVMMAAAFLAGGFVLSREFRRYGMRPDLATPLVVSCALGGLAGAKIYYAILYQDWHLLFARAGLVWYGGFAGGFIAALFFIRRTRIPLARTCDSAAPALALGYGIGRIGCFLVGDDYGRPTRSFLGIAFPHGLPPTTAASLREFGARVPSDVSPDALLRVHPTQLYEAAAGVLIFWTLLRISRNNRRPGTVFAWFLVFAGFERFLVEILRAKDDRFFDPFTLAQAISAGLLCVGGVLLAKTRGRRSEI